MKNQTRSSFKNHQNRIQHWLFEEDEDFLTGKVPANLEDTWEEEE